MWDIQRNFIISVVKFYRSVWKTVGAINAIFSVEMDIENAETPKGLEAGFAQNSRKYIIRDEIGTIDGCCIWQ